MAPPSFKDLIKEPFGPYPDSLILRTPPGKKLLQLRRLRIQQNNKFIGLDACERYLDPPAKASSPVFFFGVLVIDQLSWLSEAGNAFLKDDLNKRDENWTGQRASQNSRKSTQPRQLKLEALYGQMPGNGFKIKVWIRCEKESAAMFLTSKDYPNSLLLNSKHQHRSYEIISMDRPTYSLSSNFLERYRLVALMEQMINIPQYQLTPRPGYRGGEVDEFVTAYLIKHTKEKLSYAVIFAEEGEEPVNPRLRHVSRAEVRGIFAAHSAWLLAFYLKKKPCPLDVRAWCELIGKVRAAKKTSKSGRWSRTYEDGEIWASDEGESPADIAKTLAKFGGTPGAWEKRLTGAITKSPGNLFDDDHDVEPVNTSRRRRFASYDSDFSEPSTPGCSDSEDDPDSPSIPLPPILSHMTQPPILLPGRFIWSCPIAKCEYCIDFLNLTPQDNSVSELYVAKRQFRNLRDEQVGIVLRRRVHKHYCEDHLRIGSALGENKQEFIKLLEKWQQY
ncbi:hypothetical protein DFH06DRAFT_1313832 [Mycena polygramma]|nr:hypothetical protein DFH06DRAFT_1313832 [Mycena polygramma]